MLNYKFPSDRRRGVASDDKRATPSRRGRRGLYALRKTWRPGDCEPRRAERERAKVFAPRASALRTSRSRLDHTIIRILPAPWPWPLTLCRAALPRSRGCADVLGRRHFDTEGGKVLDVAGHDNEVVRPPRAGDNGVGYARIMSAGKGFRLQSSRCDAATASRPRSLRRRRRIGRPVRISGPPLRCCALALQQGDDFLDSWTVTTDRKFALRVHALKPVNENRRRFEFGGREHRTTSASSR